MSVIITANEKINEVLKGKQNVFFLNVFDYFLNGNQIEYEYFTDGLHLNSYGYKILSHKLVDML